MKQQSRPLFVWCVFYLCMYCVNTVVNEIVMRSIQVVILGAFKFPHFFVQAFKIVVDSSWWQHPTRLQLYGHLPPITKTIQVRRTRHAGHCWRSKDELISDVLLWTPTHGCARVGRPARTYIQQLCEDTGCNPEDLPEAMNDREKWRETVRNIRAGGATWWWWLLYILRDDWPIFMISGSNEHL